MDIANDAGEVIAQAGSDAEAVRWYLENGRRGDHLVETGEDLADVAEIIGLEVFDITSIGYDRSGQVVAR